MSGRIVVFLGPTLEKERAAELLDALYLPPAEQGSIYTAAQQLQPHAIALIDGVFAKAPAVRHKEILWALRCGIAIHGAASMGALRAAELSDHGMIGHGLIYRFYRATPFADDDEVAVAMTPNELGAQPLGEALINMRLTLRRAERRAVIGREDRLSLEEIARSMHFLDRSYPGLFLRARDALPRERARRISDLETWVAANAIDQKRADAVALLGHLAQIRTGIGHAPFPIMRAPDVRLTEAWHRDLAALGLKFKEPENGRPKHSPTSRR
jgi:hypothetical protein